MNNLSILLTGSREWDIVLSVLISMASIVLFAVIAYLTFYFFAYKMLRKRSDWGKRAFFLILVSLLGLAIRMICVLSKGVHTFQEYLTFSVQTIYATIGVFSFEGQENPGLYDLLYFYATLWVAVTYVVVIFTGFNYSLQSRIALSLPKSPRTEFYIFTKVTDESYALAVGIENRCRREHVPFKIIFASDEIDTFDAKNELHKKIRASGYYFVSIEKKATEKEKKPIIDSLGIRFWRISKVHIFAMERDESNRGNEIRNSDIIFDDIECMIRKYSKHIEEMEEQGNRLFENSNQNTKDIRNIDKNYIQYFVYVNNEVNSEFFEEMLKSKLPEGTSENTFYFIYKKFFRIKGFSEAQLCGLSLLKKRQDIEEKRILKTSTLNKTRDDIQRVLVIGFGPNGQASLKNLYIDSTSVCEGTDISSGFEAHIFDRNINSFASVYELSHPSIVFAERHEFLEKGLKLKKTVNGSDILENKYGREYDEMNFPIFCFYDIDCKNSGVLNEIVQCCKSRMINSIIVSMGNDERNIELSNALLRSIRQDVYDNDCYKEDPWQLDIFVNLREENAEKRLFWNSKLEEKVHPGINVIAYGDYENMFTYENIISEEESRQTNAIYSRLSDIYYYDREKVTLKHEYVATREKLLDIYHYGEHEEILLQYLTDTFGINDNVYDSSSYNRESSKYAHLFYRYYKAYFDSFKELTPEKKTEIYNYLAQIEHIRWNRFTIINGFIFSRNANSKTDNEEFQNNNLYVLDRRKYTKQYVKLHDDIIPTRDLKTEAMKNIYGYDYMNVLAARFFDPNKKNL